MLTNIREVSRLKSICSTFTLHSHLLKGESPLFEGELIHPYEW